MPDKPEATQIAAAGRRFVSLFALSDPAKIASCYTDDAEILSANMNSLQGVGDEWKIHRDMFASQPAVGPGTPP